MRTEGVTPQTALTFGKAGEHLVCTDLLLSGYNAYLSDQGLSYDVVVDADNHLYRIQVKTTFKPAPVPLRTHTEKYQWSVRRSGKGAKRIIGNDEFDILALVALDIRIVAYLPITDQVRQTVHLKPPNTINKINRTSAYTNKCIDEYPFENALDFLTTKRFN